jgi:hypothetical protein
MREQALKVALAVRNQTGTPPVPPDDPVPNTPNNPTTNPQSQAPNQNNNQSTAPNSDNPNSSGDPTPSGAPTTPGGPVPNPSKQPVLAGGNIKPVSQTTQGESLGWLAWGIPALLVAGLAAGVASPGIRVIAQPGHPVRRGLAGLFRRGRRRNP